MFHNHERKWKILFGFVDGLLTAAAFLSAYEFREHLPLEHQFFLVPGMLASLLAFSVATWMVSRFWLNIYARFDLVRVGRIFLDASRQTGCGVIALLVVLLRRKAGHQPRFCRRLRPADLECC